jgi:hypothetical protein
MASPLSNFYARKGYWKRKVKAVDKEVLYLLNREVRGDLSTAITDYFNTGHRLANLGELGETLASDAVNMGMSARVLDDIKDISNLLAMMSERLRIVAEEKWGDSLPNFPIYHTTLPSTANLMEAAASIRELKELKDG